MKFFLKLVLISLFFIGCKSLQTQKNKVTDSVEIDLVNIKDDHVLVSFTVPPLTNDTQVYYLPNTVPGTYRTDN